MIVTCTEPTYKIVRIFKRSGRRFTLATGQSYALVTAHCSRDDTSSVTATSRNDKRRTRRSGPWMDVFYRETR